MSIRSRIERCWLCGQRFFFAEPICVHCAFCGHLKDDEYAGIFDKKTGDWFCNVRCKMHKLRMDDVWKHRPELQESRSRGLLNAACHFPWGED